jgi:hypothetical protein
MPKGTPGKAPCSFVGCPRTAHSDGLCTMHYHGQGGSRRPCDRPDCKGFVWARGECQAHYRQSLRAARRATKGKATPAERALARQRAQRVSRGAPDTSEMRHGVCPVCPPGSPEVPLCLDHDHKTGELHGWLCRKCNMGIGLLGDSALGLQRALDYIANRR